MEKNHPVPGVDPNSAGSRDYAPGFMTDLMAKDLGLAINAAREKRVPSPVAAAAQQVYRMASAQLLRAVKLPGRLIRNPPEGGYHPSARKLLFFFRYLRFRLGRRHGGEEVRARV